MAEPNPPNAGLGGSSSVSRVQRRPGVLSQVAPSSLVVIACGGALGALGRFAIAEAWPHRWDTFPWATFVTNVLGCLFIGVLMALITELFTVHRLVRPFLGVGVLGGFTTFSTYAVEAQQLIEEQRAGLAFVYIVATVACALTAVMVGAVLTRLAASPFLRKRGLEP